MREYLVIDHTAKKSVIVDLEQAARIADLDPADIEWALEHDGVYETERHTIAEILVSARNGCPSHEQVR
jgi:hypothetical protein